MNKAAEREGKKELMYRSLVQEGMEKKDERMQDWYLRGAADQAKKEKEMDLFLNEKKMKVEMPKIGR